MKQVKPIRFKALPEDGPPGENQTGAISESAKREREQAEEEAKDCIGGERKLAPNFSFQPSYPAVIFDKVCFSVNKSQQQSNFLNELLFKAAACVGSASKAAETEQKVEILKSVSLSVANGSIFGLLGPSSCGKTTLLRCLVGLLKPSSGSISLFCRSSDEQNTRLAEATAAAGDTRPGDFYLDSFWRRRKRSARKTNEGKPCKVPGANVGYMPQDLGLYEDFTISQLLTMFGQYVGMEAPLIKARIQFMANFLDLPQVNREIATLSGGQKRRVSFAIACLHMPPLIILDEPTVGVDPLLRQSIWKYLRRLADEERKTIIITTHYIEEAAQADQVALMRAGEILVQDTPTRIMRSNNCKTLEEAFLRICSKPRAQIAEEAMENERHYKLYPQPQFNWHDQLTGLRSPYSTSENSTTGEEQFNCEVDEKKLGSLRQRAKEKVDLLDSLQRNKQNSADFQTHFEQHNAKLEEKINKLSLEPNLLLEASRLEFARHTNSPRRREKMIVDTWAEQGSLGSKLEAPCELGCAKQPRRSNGGRKLVLNWRSSCDEAEHAALKASSLQRKLEKSLTLMWALLYKNYRRNVNSIPLLAFQFLLPVVQMISFSLCVGGRPTNIGLGLVNRDQPAPADLLIATPNNASLFVAGPTSVTITDYELEAQQPNQTAELLSLKYLSFVDQSMLAVKSYASLELALADVRKAKLWAAMEIGENFTSAITQRFDLDNFYQLELATIKQSVIKLYPDRSNKVLDSICMRSLVNSFRSFLASHFQHFKQLPVEVKEPVFDIKANLISNSIDGYTESIAAGLLASLTYIMAAGLTTFIMVVERSAGILERTFTSGISPVAYLLAHALFRSLVMMLQVAVVMFLTFYLLQQPMVGSIWLAYLMLMSLNLTGIAYGLLISSLVTDQNGAALTIVSSLVVKITMSGILWPFEAIPHWLRAICYVQPLTMPVQALKTITLKGNGIEDRSVYLGFIVSFSWLALFLTISAKRFKFYQH